MNTILSVEAEKKRRGSVRIVLDNGTVLTISPEVAADAGLHQGQTLSSPDIGKLQTAQLLHDSLGAALRCLSYRPRSQAEIRSRLRHSHAPDDIVEQVLARLKEQNLVDDLSFARYWRDNRERFQPRSRRLMELELRQKGLVRETIGEAVAGVNDEANAYQAAMKKMPSLANLERPEFSKALGAYLRRRGFDYELINCTVHRLWREKSNQIAGKEMPRSDRGWGSGGVPQLKNPPLLGDQGG